jgi:hypothetical protein
MLRTVKEHAGLAALVVAVMALVMALTGIAGALPGKNKVDKNDLRKNVVKSKNVAPDALTGKDIKEGTLKVTQRTATLGPITSGNIGDKLASCQGNETAVGGGFSASSGFGRIDASRPELNAQGKPTGWHVFVGNDSPGDASFIVYALCQG